MIAFRDATAADLPAVVALLADDELGGGREDPGPPLPDAYEAGFAAMMAQGGRIVLAVEDDLVLGCLQLDILHGVSTLGTVRAQVEGVRVARSRRGEGVGALLMGEAVRRATAAGARTVQLTTNLARLDARRFYERLGFDHTHAGMKLAL